MFRKKRLFSPVVARFVWVFFLIGLSLSCNLVDQAVHVQATLTAIQSIQTELASTGAVFTEVASRLNSTPEPINHPTNIAATDSAPGVENATPTNAQVESPPQTIDLDERTLKSAKILLFEDMSASRYIRLVKEALDRGNYFYLDVGSAKGWFKSQLLSSQEWDLVIAAAEAERDFGGEFFEYLSDQLDRGAALIIENWDLDFAPLGRARPLLEKCGVRFQSDWFQPELRVFYWTDPSHPIFNQPNALSRGLRNAPALWKDDLGDLLAVDLISSRTIGEPIILASTNAGWKSDHGLLVSCVEGRMILQTFRSHEYQHDDMVALWQNYIYNVLKSRFTLMNRAPPTPVMTSLPSPSASPVITEHAPTPGPDYTFPHDCGGLLTVRLTRAPQFLRDLFEHHAQGIFLITYLEIVNQSNFAIQIWDEDYSLEGSIRGNPVQYPPHRAATGYLYIEQGTNLYQDLIQPGETWRTVIAFDVDPSGGGWTLILRPGSEFNEQVCEARLSLDR